MKLKEGLGWKACHNEKKNVYGAEVCFQGSWDCYEISADVFARLDPRMNGSAAEELIRSGRHIYMHVNDRCGPPYTVVLDEDYADYCAWMKRDKEPEGKTWSPELTDAAVELLDSEKANREQRRKKRAKRKKD